MNTLEVQPRPDVLTRPPAPALTTLPAVASRVATGMPAWLWAVLAMSAATMPFLPGLSGSRIFYIRDLSLYFWGRYLWLRRTMFAGEWPLWDPYVGGGQSAVADALHQMFLLPVLLIRMVGTEVIGFNLWVALPFPLAALGAWLFFARRFSPSSAAVGSLAFSLAGPVMSTGNFPNMSWAVATMPWVLWSVDRVAVDPTPRGLVVLTLAVAFQALAGEPVTFSATLALASASAVFLATPSGLLTLGRRGRSLMWVAGGIVLGAMLAAIQLVPMVEAALLAERSKIMVQGVWSLHPLALVETLALHIFGDYFLAQSLANVPWLTLVNTGREPFFFSLYLGVPLLSVTLFGLVATGRNRWSAFWAAAGAAALVLAFGVYTPVYPFLRDHLPLLGSFRFPVKYLVVLCMAVAAGAAAGWEVIRGCGAAGQVSRLIPRARFDAVGFALVIAVVAGGLAAACIYLPGPTAVRLSSLAGALGLRDGAGAAALMLRVLPRVATTVMLVSLATSALVFLATSRRAGASLARLALLALLAGDLLVRAWGINPAFDPAYLARPEWLARTASDPDSRFYVGGKKDGTLDGWDLDASRAFLNPPGLVGSASRAALSGQSAFYPSAWPAREMLSYDLALLWPRDFQLATDRFFAAGRDERDRFLDRTGVRYRVLPARLGAGHAPLVKVPYYLESSLYDWGSSVAPRVSVVPAALVVADIRQQIAALFDEGWDRRATALIDRLPGVGGEPKPAVTPFARIVRDASNRVAVEAGADAGGGYLVLLDSYSNDWHATLDGTPVEMVRANGLFRAVRLPAGQHVVEFSYRPRAFILGAAVAAVALVMTLGLWVAGRTRRSLLAI